MNYISLLNEHELVIICEMISGKCIKALFRKHSKEFTKIKKGFRPVSLKDSEAVNLAVKNIDKNFISAFINDTIEEWLLYIDIKLGKYDNADSKYDSLLAEVLKDSKFNEYPELYFILSQKNFSNKQVECIRQYMSESDSTEEQLESDTVSIGISEIKEQIDKKDSEISSLKQQLQEADNELNDIFLELEKLRLEKNQADDKIRELEQRLDYIDDDIADNEDLQDYEYISLCEVSEPDYSGQIWLIRLADLNRNGQLERFYPDENRPTYFGNRTRLYFKDGPNDAGCIAVWNWKASENYNDPSKDYVSSEFNSKALPIEVIVLDECRNEWDIIERMKEGMDISTSAKRILFASYLSKGQFVGIICNEKELDQKGEYCKISEKVIHLPKYSFTPRDIIKFENGRSFFRYVKLGAPDEIISVKDPLEVVKEVVMSRYSWQTFKKIGKTRNEWKLVREFLDDLDTKSVVDEISDALMCTRIEADGLLLDFCQCAGEYIDGTSIEDSVLEALLSTNSDLVFRCKEILREEWKEENKVALEEAERQLEDINRSISDKTIAFQAKQEYDESRHKKYMLEAEEKLAVIQEKHDKLQADLDKISEMIHLKEKLADDVEQGVKERIKKAQENAAEFLADMAFLKPAYQEPISEDIKTNNVMQRISASDEISIYECGTPLREENLQECLNWEDVIDQICDNFIDIGVISEYARPLAAYLYSAYYNNVPILLIGPRGSEIADAFSASIYGKTAGMFDCGDGYNAVKTKRSLINCDRIVKIVNPFFSNWVSHIPEIVANKHVFFFIIHPYMEDVVIEPKSIYSYMLPLCTEYLIENDAAGITYGGWISTGFKEFKSETTNKKQSKFLKELHMNLLVKNRIQNILNDMHTILKDQNEDWDVLFSLFSYAYVTSQSSVILDAIENSENKNISISKRVQTLLTGLYGEC